jgi:hypothetical protein
MPPSSQRTLSTLLVLTFLASGACGGRVVPPSGDDSQTSGGPGAPRSSGSSGSSGSDNQGRAQAIRFSAEGNPQVGALVALACL